MFERALSIDQEREPVGAGRSAVASKASRRSKYGRLPLVAHVRDPFAFQALPPIQGVRAFFVGGVRRQTAAFSPLATGFVVVPA